MNLLTRVAAVSAVSLIFAGAQASITPAHQPSSDNSTKKHIRRKKPVKMEKTKPSVVTVESGDTLATIAKDNNTTWRRIYDKNPSVDDPDLIYPGQKLSIPASDEKLAHRSLPVKVMPAPKKPVTHVTYAAEPTKSTPVVQEVAAPEAPSGSVWDKLANCESSGNWSANTGNGFYGGLQFTLESWRAVGGSGLPSNASRSEQIMRAEKLQAMQGWGAWPVCSVKVGLR